MVNKVHARLVGWLMFALFLCLTSPAFAQNQLNAATSFSFSGSAGGGGSGPPQDLFITSTGSSLPYTITAATNSGGNWLRVFLDPGQLSRTTPSREAVSVDTLILPAGTYTGTVTVTAPGAANSPIIIPVTATIAPNPLRIGNIQLQHPSNWKPVVKDSNIVLAPVGGANDKGDLAYGMIIDVFTPQNARNLEQATDQFLSGPEDNRISEVRHAGSGIF